MFGWNSVHLCFVVSRVIDQNSNDSINLTYSINFNQSNFAWKQLKTVVNMYTNKRTKENLFCRPSPRFLLQKCFSKLTVTEALGRKCLQVDWWFFFLCNEKLVFWRIKGRNEKWNSKEILRKRKNLGFSVCVCCCVRYIRTCMRNVVMWRRTCLSKELPDIDLNNRKIS